MVRLLIKVLGSRAALVGWTDDPSAPIGEWHRRVLNGVEHDYFATRYFPEPKFKKSIIPERVVDGILFKKHGKAILSHGINNLITQEPVALMALPLTPKTNVCYWYPGVFRTLSVSSYFWVKPLAVIFDYFFNRRLKKVTSQILAAADLEAITAVKKRSHGVLENCSISVFPTRVDTKIFSPGNKTTSRKNVSIPKEKTLIVTSGRLHWQKGWPLLLDAYDQFHKTYPDSLLVFVGDGTDRNKIQEKISQMNLMVQVKLVGHQTQESLVEYLKAADLFVMGSLEEGWCTSLVEALACGLPMVATPFSSAKSMIKNGTNGFVVERDAFLFSEAMKKALKLKTPKRFSMKEIKKYSLSRMGVDLEKAWKMI